LISLCGWQRRGVGTHRCTSLGIMVLLVLRFMMAIAPSNRWTAQARRGITGDGGSSTCDGKTCFDKIIYLCLYVYHRTMDLAIVTAAIRMTTGWTRQHARAPSQL
jgi:hypothetical protein